MSFEPDTLWRHVSQAATLGWPPWCPFPLPPLLFLYSEPFTNPHTLTHAQQNDSQAMRSDKQSKQIECRQERDSATFPLRLLLPADIFFCCLLSLFFPLPLTFSLQLPQFVLSAVSSHVAHTRRWLRHCYTLFKREREIERVSKGESRGYMRYLFVFELKRRKRGSCKGYFDRVVSVLYRVSCYYLLNIYIIY